MYTVKQGGDIHTGDIIAVANGNDFSVGIYFGKGRGGTVQYFYPGAPGQSKHWHTSRSKTIDVDKVKPFKLSDIWKSYINAPRDTRIMKLNRDNITDQETIDQLSEAKEILEKFNITVNY